MRTVYAALVWVELLVVAAVTAVAAFALANWSLGMAAHLDRQDAAARLVRAVQLGDTSGAAAMLSSDPGLANFPDCVGWTPLHEAAIGDDSAMVALLIEKGADVNATDGVGVTPLHAAARAGQVGAARILLDRGAGIEMIDNWGCTPLDCARQTGRWEVVRILRARAASLRGSEAAASPSGR